MKHTCHDCQQAIPPGQAVLRAANFEQVAFHRECWALRLVPPQREPSDSSLSYKD
jgi:hypothetical protein